MTASEKRKAGRIATNIPMVVESIGQPPIKLHPNLAKVYSRVSPNGDAKGEKFPATLRDLSTNGAFIVGDPLPLLARVAFSFELPDFGRIEAIGWTLWRRSDDCEIPCEGASPIVLAKGFGLLFEAIPLDARMAIHRMVKNTVAN
jgi:hypothetical protein